MRTKKNVADEMVSNETFNPQEYYEKIYKLEEKLYVLLEDAKSADLLKNEVKSGRWFWKTTKVNPEKLGKACEIMANQAELNLELMETQQQALLFSVSSIETSKKVHESLTDLITKTATNTTQKTIEIAEKNGEIVKKTEEQILRVAQFSKKYADLVKEIEKRTEQKIDELREEYSSVISGGKNTVNSIGSIAEKELNKKFVQKTDLIEIQESIDSLKNENQVMNTTFSEMKKILSENYVQKNEIDLLKNIINEQEEKNIALISECIKSSDFEEYKQNLNDLFDKYSLKEDVKKLQNDIALIMENQKKLFGWKAILKRGLLFILYMSVGLGIIGLIVLIIMLII